MASQSENKNTIMSYLVPVVLATVVSCSAGYLAFQRSVEARISVLETQIKTQTEELARHRDLINSTVEPRLRSIETQLSAIRAILEAGKR